MAFLLESAAEVWRKPLQPVQQGKCFLISVAVTRCRCRHVDRIRIIRSLAQDILKQGSGIIEAAGLHGSADRFQAFGNLGGVCGHVGSG